MRAYPVVMTLLAFPFTTVAQTAPTPPPVTAPASVEAVRGTTEAISNAVGNVPQDKRPPTPVAEPEKKKEEKK